MLPLWTAIERALRQKGNNNQQVGDVPNLYRPGCTEYMMAKDLTNTYSA